MAYWKMPYVALTAAHVMITVISIGARDRLTKRYTTGTRMNSTSCLQSIRLARTSDESPAEMSVTTAYASNGQKK